MGVVVKVPTSRQNALYGIDNYLRYNSMYNKPIHMQ